MFRLTPGYIDNSKIKSVGNHPGGPVTIRVPGDTANPNGSWGNGNIWRYGRVGSSVGNRYLRGSAIHKARPVVWETR
ncbi:hypothetical protein [Micromonospora sp. KLBMP9576]|uniref:hypothetical protein n=1 Tax=Micromonospora sp. KLBMP9576 TaxID=3424769 RepID=UPI003D8F61C0